MAKTNRTLLVDGYQPRAPKSGSKVARSAHTGQLVSVGPKKLPKAVSAIKTPTQKKSDK